MATFNMVISGSGDIPGDILVARAMKNVLGAGYTIDSATLNGVNVRTALHNRLFTAAMLAYTEPAHSGKAQDQALVHSIVDQIITSAGIW